MRQEVRVIAIRHAPVSVQGICYGHLDIPVILTHEQSFSEVRTTLREIGSLSLWSSPAERCLGPAKVAATELGVPLQTSELLREINFGSWEGRRWDELEKEEPEAMKAWGKDWVNYRVPGGESALDLEARVQRWLNGLEPGLHVVFSHGGFVRGMRVLVNGATWKDAMGEQVAHLTLYQFVIP